MPAEKGYCIMLAGKAKLAKAQFNTGTSMLAALLFCSAINPAIAKAADPADPAPAAAAPDDGTIVVTAQRRAQSTLDVGINVTEVTPQRLADERIVRIGELIQATSNIEVREIRPGGGQPAITIRGVGMNDFTVASNPSTAVYFDGVYSPNIGTISQQFFDLGQVEILKGPQSSLYGRNATAGAINIVSAKPTEDFSGYVTGGYGNFNSVDAEGAISGRIAQNLTARVSVKTRQEYDGWMNNIYPGGDDIGTIHQTSVRAQLKWNPSERFELHTIFGYQHEDDEPGAFTAFGRHVAGGAPGATTGICAVSAANMIDFNNTCYSIFGTQRTSTDVLTISENDHWNVRGNSYTGTAIGTYQGDGFTVKSVTGYLHWQEQYIKSDALPVTEQTATLDQRTWQVSEDLQIASSGKKRLEWVAGVYLSTANTNDPTYTIAPINNGNYIATNSADTKTAQAYAQLDFNLTSKLQLTAGARYIYEHDSKVGGTWLDTNSNHVIDAADKNQAFLDDSFNQHAVTWKFGINYKPTSTTLLYGSITHGFKSGGYIAPSVATSTSQLLPYKGENIYSFEVGGKKTLFDNMIDLSTSLFYYDYHDLQTNQQQLVGNLNVNRFANVPHAHIKGIDLEAAFRPIKGFELKLDGGLIDTWVGIFTSGGVNFAPGNRFANAPTFAGTASIRYQWHLIGDFDMAMGGSIHHSSSTFANTENTPLYRIDSVVTLVNAQVQLLLPAKGWTAMVWGKNLTNTEYTNSTFQNGSVVNTLYNMPRTYGISVTKRF
jgi:iron complex outermembrane receptor protein